MHLSLQVLLFYEDNSYEKNRVKVKEKFELNNIFVNSKTFLPKFEEIMWEIEVSYLNKTSCFSFINYYYHF